MTVIKSPVKNYNGVTAGVQFKDGAGQTDSPRAIEWLIAHGYVAEPSADEIAAALAEAQAKADAEEAAERARIEAEEAAALADAQVKADAEAEAAKNQAPPPDPANPPYDADMKIDDLRVVALVYGVDASKIQKKTDIVAAIDAALKAKEVANA